jgi:hypothetical protein
MPWRHLLHYHCIMSRRRKLALGADCISLYIIYQTFLEAPSKYCLSFPSQKHVLMDTSPLRVVGIVLLQPNHVHNSRGLNQHNVHPQLTHNRHHGSSLGPHSNRRRVLFNNSNLDRSNSSNLDRCKLNQGQLNSHKLNSLDQFNNHNHSSRDQCRFNQDQPNNHNHSSQDQFRFNQDPCSSSQTPLKGTMEIVQLNSSPILLEITGIVQLNNLTHFLEIMEIVLSSSSSLEATVLNLVVSLHELAQGSTQQSLEDPHRAQTVDKILDQPRHM